MFNKDKTWEKFPEKVWLSSPTMYETSMQYAMEAYRTNWNVYRWCQYQRTGAGESAKR